jgi:hypothetical protein
VISPFFSLLAYRNVRRQMPIIRRKLDRQMTSIILARVAFLTILILPYTIQRIYSLILPANRNDLVRIASEQLIAAVTISFLCSNCSVCNLSLFIDLDLILIVGFLLHFLDFISKISSQCPTTQVLNLLFRFNVVLCSRLTTFK